MKYSFCHQIDLGVDQPTQVLWEALQAHLTPEAFAAVQANYRRQSRRYQRACALNRASRWVWRVGRNGPQARDRERYDRWVAALGDPMTYINGEAK